jgi:hypothetical protein
MLLTLQSVMRAETKLAMELAAAIVEKNDFTGDAAAAVSKEESVAGPAKSGFAHSSSPAVGGMKSVKILSRTASSKDLKDGVNSPGGVASDSPLASRDNQYPPVNELRGVLKRLWEMKDKIPKLNFATGRQCSRSTQLQSLVSSRSNALIFSSLVVSV